MPPAFDTAEASWARAIQPIGAWIIGYWVPSISVTRFFMHGFSCRIFMGSFYKMVIDAQSRGIPNGMQTSYAKQLKMINE
jgi:hypothetical protein